MEKEMETKTTFIFKKKVKWCLKLSYNDLAYLQNIEFYDFVNFQ